MEIEETGKENDVALARCSNIREVQEASYASGNANSQLPNLGVKIALEIVECHRLRFLIILGP